MACPYCQVDATQEMERTTALGYRLFRCRPCRRTVNERTGTQFNHLQVPTDVALLVVLWLVIDTKPRTVATSTVEQRHQSSNTSLKSALPYRRPIEADGDMKRRDKLEAQR